MCHYCETEAWTSQPWNGGPRKLTEQGQWSAEQVKTVYPLLHHSLHCPKLHLEATSEQELGIGSFTKSVSRTEKLHASLRSICAITSVGWSKALKTLEQWNRVFWSDESCFAILSAGWWMKLGLVDARRMNSRNSFNLHSASSTVWWRRDNGTGLVFRVWARLLCSSQG